MITSTLTVKENIAFSAFIRMSPDTTAEERQQRVCDVLEKMNLEDCANTRVSKAKSYILKHSQFQNISTIMYIIIDY